MKKIIVIGLFLLVSVGLLTAAPTTCSFTTTVSALIALGSTGCVDAGGDVLFNNFSYTDLSGGTTPAAAVNASFISAPNTNGWTFTPTTGAWTVAGFDLGFTVQIEAGFPLESITGSQDQIEGGQVPNGISSVDTQTYGTITVTGASTGAETMQINDPNVQLITTGSVATLPSNFISSYSQEFFDVTSPEPATLGLLGLGLLGIGYLSRRRSRKNL